MKIVKHPLIAPAHYKNKGKKSDIATLESENILEDMIAWNKITIRKYELRLNKKGQHDSDLEKIANYKRYLTFLYDVFNVFNSKYTEELDEMTVTEVYAFLKFDVQYDN